MTVACTIADNIAEVVMHNPPVNAITVGDTWKIHDIFKELSDNKELRAVILTAEGKASMPVSTSRRCRPTRRPATNGS